jgi:hypothetical protein
VAGGALLAAATMAVAYPLLIRTLVRLEADFTPEAARPG